MSIAHTHTQIWNSASTMGNMTPLSQLQSEFHSFSSFIGCLQFLSVQWINNKINMKMISCRFDWNYQKLWFDYWLSVLLTVIVHIRLLSPLPLLLGFNSSLNSHKRGNPTHRFRHYTILSRAARATSLWIYFLSHFVFYLLLSTANEIRTRVCVIRGMCYWTKEEKKNKKKMFKLGQRMSYVRRLRSISGTYVIVSPNGTAKTSRMTFLCKRFQLPAHFTQYCLGLGWVQSTQIFAKSTMRTTQWQSIQIFIELSVCDMRW